VGEISAPKMLCVEKKVSILRSFLALSFMDAKAPVRDCLESAILYYFPFRNEFI